MSLRPRGIVLHLSASRFGDAATFRRWHVQDRGWSDIGYHRVILNGVRRAQDRYDATLDGVIERGRADSVVGAHCAARGMNRLTLGVCCVGEPGHLPPFATPAPAGATVRPWLTQRQWESLVRELASICRVRGWNPEGTFESGAGPVPVITQHSDHDPGKPIDASLHLPTLRRAVAAALRGS